MVKGITGRERRMNRSLEEESCHHFSAESQGVENILQSKRVELSLMTFNQNTLSWSVYSPVPKDKCFRNRETKKKNSDIIIFF